MSQGMNYTDIDHERYEGDDTDPNNITEENLQPRDSNQQHNSSTGTTSVIRKKLKFTDEVKWKKFSSRRLQLVESLSLSSKKASEQDDEIKVCAQNLMKEFNFPESSLMDFDKLVRLAIQSVRRNKKRSEKRMANKLENHQIDRSDEETLVKRQKLDDSTNSLKFLSSIIVDEELKNGDTNEKSNSIEKPEDSSSRLAINSLVAPILPDADKLPSLRHLNLNPEFNIAAQSILSCIKKSRTCYEFSKNSHLPSNLNQRTRNYDLLEELGSNCISSAAILTLERWFDHLLPDSSSYIKLRLKGDLSLSLIIKNLDKNSIEVNRLSDYIASQLFKKLIGGCVKDFGFNVALMPLCDIFHNIVLKDYPLISKDDKQKQETQTQTQSELSNQNQNVQSQYYPKLFNQDPLFNDISIIDSTISKPVILSGTDSIHSHNSILNMHKPIITDKPPETNEFPLSTAHLPLPPAPTVHYSVDLMDTSSSYSLPPILRPKSQQTRVKIKFNDKELNFTYCIDKNAPPTLLELITNCKHAFGIVNSTRVLKLRNARTGIVIKTDYELERTFKMTSLLSDGEGEVQLEMIFPNVVQDYLNLNYDTNEKPMNVNSNIRTVTVDNKASNSTSIVNSHANGDNPGSSCNSSSNNNSATEGLRGRYLPPPRPLHPDPKRRAFTMKFQPLL